MAQSELVRAALNVGISSVAVMVVAAILPGFRVHKWSSAVIFALLVSVFKWVAWQAFPLLSISITVLTLGIGALIINGLVLLVAQKLTKGVEISGCFVASIAYILISLVDVILHSVLRTAL